MRRRSVIQANSSCVDEDQGAPAAALLPTQIVQLPTKDSDENDSVASSVSSLIQEEDEVASLQSMPSSPPSPRSTKPRSIFGTYWLAEGECPPKQLLPPRPLSPKCVTQCPYNIQFYSPTMEELLVQQALEEEDDDLNTYERTLRDCEEERMKNWRKMNPLATPFESPPLWFTWFQTKTRSQSARSLPVHDLTRLGGTLTRCRQIQSDSALHTKPPTSVLRQGRFSKNNQQRTTCCTSNNAAATSRHVHFQARVQICSFQPPMESWASDGWSEWFGS